MINPKIEFTKVRDVKTPNRANPSDAGIDFFIPNFTEEFFQDLKEKNKKNNISYEVKEGELYITLAPLAQICIPSGIKTIIHDLNTFLQATEKSGVAVKHNLLVGANAIDPQYRGEIHINLFNCSNEYVTISTNEKIVQFIHRQFISTELSEISNDEYNNYGSTSRGEGGFGSTGSF